MQVHYYVERVATRLEHASMAMKHCSQIRHYIALSKEKRIDINLKICVITIELFHGSGKHDGYPNKDTKRDLFPRFT